MQKAGASAILMVVAILSSSGREPAKGQTRQQSNLWAAISVAKPAFNPGEGRTIAIHFAVVNDFREARHLHGPMVWAVWAEFHITRNHVSGDVISAA